MNQKIKLATLPKNSVNKTITNRIPIITQNQTVDEIIDLLPTLAKKMNSINYLYVVNKQNKLKGVVSIKELIQQKPETKISEIMVRNPVTASPQLKKERAAHLAIKHNLKALPIVNKKGHLLGALSNDKILSILYKQYRKSFQHFAGTISLEQDYATIMEHSVVKNVSSRLPWIIVGLFGGIIAAQVINLFDNTLTEHVVLAVFIPLVTYISSAVGSQTQTFLIRDIAFSPKLKIIPYFFRQLFTSFFMGFVCGGLIWLVISLFWNSSYLGFVVGLASFISIFLSTVIAVSIPYLLYILKQEPASGSGPFATTLQDLLTIFLYFFIASILL